MRDDVRKQQSASYVIAVDGIPERLEMAKRMGADEVIDFREQDPIAAVKRATDGLPRRGTRP